MQWGHVVQMYDYVWTDKGMFDPDPAKCLYSSICTAAEKLAEDGVTPVAGTRVTSAQKEGLILYNAWDGVFDRLMQWGHVVQVEFP